MADFERVLAWSCEAYSFTSRLSLVVISMGYELEYSKYNEGLGNHISNALYELRN